MLSDGEVDVITDLRPVDALQKLDVTLFFTRYSSDLSAPVRSSCCRSMLAVLKR